MEINGHTILMPDRTTWGDLFAISTTDKEAAPPAHTVRFKDYKNRAATMLLGPYCRIMRDGSYNAAKYVAAHPDVAEAILNNTVWIEHETMNYSINVWPDGRALVLAEHSRILGDVWVAVIDAATIPA